VRAALFILSCLCFTWAAWTALSFGLQGYAGAICLTLTLVGMALLATSEPFRGE
jgi:hypothetical protein